MQPGLVRVLSRSGGFRAYSGRTVLKSGDVFSTSQKFTSADVNNFLQVTGDPNAIHEDPVAARAAGFRGPILPGMLCASMFPALIAHHFPGALYMSQTLKFRSSALVGSEVQATVTVANVSGPHVRFSTVCSIAEGQIIVDGIALARIPDLQQIQEQI